MATISNLREVAKITVVPPLQVRHRGQVIVQET